MRKKQNFRALALILAILAATIPSCGESEIPSDGTTPENVPESTTETVTETVEVSSLPENYDLENYEFRLLRQSPSLIGWSLNEFAPSEQTGEVLSDAFYTRNQKVTEQYNFKITVIDDDAQTKTIVRKSVLAGDDEYDAALIRIDEELSAYDGTYLNLLELPNLDLEKSWWSQSLIRDLTIGGKLPFITGDIIVCENDSMLMTLYNSALGKDFGIGNLYEVVNNGEWTIDKMSYYMKSVNADLNNDGKYDENDRYGLLYVDNSAALPYFAGAETYLFEGHGDEITYNANSERALTVYEKMQKLLSDNTMTYNWANLKTDVPQKIAGMIEAKQLLFQTTPLSFLRRSLRDVKTDFGIIPLPKYDENQENYATCIATATPYLFVPSTVKETEKVGFILEALAAESKPITETYYTVAMQSKYTRDAESYEMIELAMKNIVFDTGFVFNFGGLMTSIRRGIMSDTPYASMIASGESAAMKAVEDFYTSLH